MARIRSVLMDNTLGRIFTNIEAPSKAMPANLLAGTKLSTLSFSGNKKGLVRVANNIGTTTGMKFLQRSQIVKIRAYVTLFGRGGDVVINVRKGTSYVDSTVISTLSILDASTATELPVLITVEIGEKLFVDIVSVPTVKIPSGFAINFDYYAG